MQFLKKLSGKEILTEIKGHHPVINKQKMKANKPKLDPVNMNAYIKFGAILSFCSQHIEWKFFLGVNQGP